jgi:hypothetical protein
MGKVFGNIALGNLLGSDPLSSLPLPGELVGERGSADALEAGIGEEVGLLGSVVMNSKIALMTERMPYPTPAIPNLYISHDYQRFRTDSEFRLSSPSGEGLGMRANQCLIRQCLKGFPEREN